VELIRHRIPGKHTPITIAPIGDIQWAGKRQASNIALSHLKDHIARAMDRKAWFIGMGDYLDFASPSNRQRLKGAALYDTAEQVIEDKALEMVLELYDEILKPTKGRWLGMLEGHHFSVLTSGETTDHRLCQMLEAPFAGTSCFIGIQFPVPNGNHYVYNIWAHHGAGGGQKAHAPIMKLESAATYWDADLMLIGHMTKVAVAPLKRIRPEWRGPLPSLQERTIHVVGTGGWMKGYPERAAVGRFPRGGYVEQKMLNPVVLGAPFITVTPKVSWINGGASSPRRVRAGLPARRLWMPEVVVEV
jgi:hypothetical protein